MRKLPIFYNALLLTAVSLLLRLIGTGFQVFISSRVGAEGVGLLQLTMSVGMMAMVAGMAGIRTATMYLTAEEIGKNRSSSITGVLSACILYSLVFSISVSVLLYSLAPWLAENWIDNPNTTDGLRLFSFFLPVNCLCGVLVGYFTGANRITTLAAVEIAEQLCSMTATFVFLNIWDNSSPEKACLAVILGNACGTCVTLLCLMILRIREHPASDRSIPIYARLFRIALPLALADDLRTGISTVENLMVPKRLSLFPGSDSPLAAFGMVCGMVFPILMFPAAILFGLTELLVPELARCKAAGSDKRIHYLIRKSLRIALLYGTVCAGILFLCADSLCEGLYHSREAGVYLKWFAPLAVMLYCDSVTDAMIKGLGQQKISVRYNIFTSAMDVALLFILLPRYGMSGYLFSFAVTHGINFILSIRRLLQISGEKIRLHIPILTILSGCVCVTAAGFVSSPTGRSIAYILLLGSSLSLLGIIGKEDIVWVKGLIHK